MFSPCPESCLNRRDSESKGIGILPIEIQMEGSNIQKDFHETLCIFLAQFTYRCTDANAEGAFASNHLKIGHPQDSQDDAPWYDTKNRNKSENIINHNPKQICRRSTTLIPQIYLHRRKYRAPNLPTIKKRNPDANPRPNHKQSIVYKWTTWWGFLPRVLWRLGWFIDM